MGRKRLKVGEKNVVCRVSDDEIRSHPHSHSRAQQSTDKAHGDCGLGGYGVWGDGSEGAIHKARRGKARQQAGKTSVSVSVIDV